MGNSMGHIWTNGYNLHFHPHITPDPEHGVTFDHNLGFEGKRVPREMHATEEQMYSVKMPLRDRDYCAHHLLQFMKCRKDVWPWAVKCSHEKHEYLKCRYEDWVLNMKEYERERRLKVLMHEEAHG